MIIKKGSTGPEVKKIQEKLGIAPDGDFGSMTEQKVKDWQSKNGLLADGIIGPNTWDKMFTPVVSAPVTPPVTPPVPVSPKPTTPPSTFKLERLRGHVPESVIAQIPDTARRFGITNVLRLAHFLAQCSHESGGFSVVSENLNYSVDGLKRVFPRYFPGNSAASYAKNPEKIGSRVYASRMGNGAESTKDGYRFRGRGYIQLTGKSNYTALSKFIGEDCVANPDLVSTKYPLSSAAFFFQSNGLWSICDKGADDATITAVSKRVNGGTIGLSDRMSHFKEFYSLLK